MIVGAVPRLLASDLDGTLIPPDQVPERLRELQELRRDVEAMDLALAYVTGRRLPSALRGIERFGLPLPEALACEVGTTVYWRRDGTYAPDREYQDALAASPGFVAAARVQAALADLEALRLQDPENQNAFKVSYFLDAVPSPELLDQIRTRLADEGRVRLVASHDPINGVGFLDLLPHAAGKANAVRCVTRKLGMTDDDVVFAGDSGNDTDALLSGVRAVLVGNAPATLRSEVRASAESRGLQDRVYFASSHFAAGVLEGLHHFASGAST